MTSLLRAAVRGGEGAVAAAEAADAAALAAFATTYGTPLLHLAAARNDAALLAALLARGGADEADALGRTALHYAAEQGHQAAVSALLRAGCAIDAADASGATALHLAVRAGRAAVARMLGAFKANTMAVDGRGRTPLDLAVLFGHDALLADLGEADHALGAVRGGNLLAAFWGAAAPAGEPKDQPARRRSGSILKTGPRSPRRGSDRVRILSPGSIVETLTSSEAVPLALQYIQSLAKNPAPTEIKAMVGALASLHANLDRDPTRRDAETLARVLSVFEAAHELDVPETGAVHGMMLSLAGWRDAAHGEGTAEEKVDDDHDDDVPALEDAPDADIPELADAEAPPSASSTDASEQNVVVVIAPLLRLRSKNIYSTLASLDVPSTWCHFSPDDDVDGQRMRRAYVTLPNGSMASKVAASFDGTDFHGFTLRCRRITKAEMDSERATASSPSLLPSSETAKVVQESVPDLTIYQSGVVSAPLVGFSSTAPSASRGSWSEPVEPEPAPRARKPVRPVVPMPSLGAAHKGPIVYEPSPEGERSDVGTATEAALEHMLEQLLAVVAHPEDEDGMNVAVFEHAPKSMIFGGWALEELLTMDPSPLLANLCELFAPKRVKYLLPTRGRGQQLFTIEVRWFASPDSSPRFGDTLASTARTDMGSTMATTTGTAFTDTMASSLQVSTQSHSSIPIITLTGTASQIPHVDDLDDSRSPSPGASPSPSPTPGTDEPRDKPATTPLEVVERWAPLQISMFQDYRLRVERAARAPEPTLPPLPARAPWRAPPFVAIQAPSLV